MSKSKKSLIVISVGAVIIGCIIFFITSAAIGFDFSKFNTVEYETNIYQIEEPFENIEIDTTMCDIRFVPSKNDTIEVTCTAEKDRPHKAYVENNTLKINYVDNRNWYHFIDINWNSYKAEITVSLPLHKVIPVGEYTEIEPFGQYGNLYLKSSSGDIDIPECFGFHLVEINTSSGDVNCKNDSSDVTINSTSGNIYLSGISTNNMDLSTSSGAIKLSDMNCSVISAESNSGDIELTNIMCSDISAEVTSGDINFSIISSSNIFAESTSGDINFSAIRSKEISVKATSGDVELKETVCEGNINMKTTSGEINLKDSDGKSLEISSTSGDVYGNLLTEKLFITETNSGDIDVPAIDITLNKTLDKCRINTTSGDIKMKTN